MRDLWLWSSKGVIVIRSEHTGCVTYVNTHPAERLQVRLRLKHTDPETEKENVKLQLESECEGCCWELNPQLWWCCVGDMELCTHALVLGKPMDSSTSRVVPCLTVLGRVWRCLRGVTLAYSSS